MATYFIGIELEIEADSLDSALYIAAEVSVNAEAAYFEVSGAAVAGEIDQA